MARLTNGPADLGPDLHDGLLQGIVVACPSIPVDAVGKAAVWPAKVPAVQVAVVAVAVPPSALPDGDQTGGITSWLADDCGSFSSLTL